MAVVVNFDNTAGVPKHRAVSTPKPLASGGAVEPPYPLADVTSTLNTNLNGRFTADTWVDD